MGQPSLGSRRPTLVGRELELSVLNGLAKRASAGATQLAVISGDPGVGKTRLVAEVVGRRTAAGWTALVGSADGLRATPPYGPFVEALRSLTDRPGADPIAVLAGDWTRHLSLVLPELGPAGRDADREALPEAWAQVLRRVSAAGPTIVALDDLGWADAASLDLLVYLRRRLRDERLLIMATHRSEDAAHGGRLEPLFEELSRQRLAVPVELGPLTGDETAALAGRLLGGPVSPRLARLVAVESEGNPFFAEEIVRSLAEHGRLVVQDGRWGVVGDERTDLTPSARTVLSARLRPLEPEARRVLGVAAVLGRRSTAAEIGVIADLDEAGVEELLAEAVRRRLVVEDRDVYAFAHERIREALYDALSPVQRRRIHDRAADALERSTSATSADPARVARHRLRGEHPAGALAALTEAGARASASGAFDDAADHYAAAVDLRRGGPPGDLAASLLPLGAALADAGRYPEAIAALEEGIRLVDTSDAATDGFDLAGLLCRLGEVHLAREDPEAAERALDRALALCASDDPGRVPVLLALGRLHVAVTGRLADGRRFAEEAATMAAAVGDAEREAEAFALLAQAAMHSGHFAEGRRIYGEAAAIAERVHAPGLAQEVADGLARLHYWTAAFHDLRTVAARELDSALLSGDPHRLGWPTFWLAQAALGLAEWEEARRHAAALTRLGSELGARRFAGQGRELVGLVAYWTGSFDEAVRELREAVAQLRSIGPGTLVYYLGPYGLALAAAGDRAGADAVAEELLELARSFPRASSPRVQACNVAVRLLVALGRRDEIAPLAEELAPAADQFHWFPVATSLGLISLGRDPLAAARHYEVARRLVAGGGGAVHLAGALAGEAEVARRSGRPTEAAAMDRRAAEIVRAAHASPIAAGLRWPDPAAAAVAPGGRLSPRELEVLRLVASGRTNREIAAALRISEKTAVNHLTHIFDKLGVDNRSAATAWAFRHDLA